MKPSYLNLCTEFYDLTKPEAGPKEIAFYGECLKAAKGPILEAMCGSGRLLIPLLKKGFLIEGVDNSQHMLQSCQKRCSAQGLSVQLHNQSLQTLNLPKKYDVIFIAIGSFQLIHEEGTALHVLENLRAALLPGGRLIIETFVPWDSIKDNIHGSTLANQSSEVSFEKTVDATDGSQIIHKSAVNLYFNEQLEKTKSSYEKWIGKRLISSEEEEYIVRWHHRFEMQLLLEKAGFAAVKILDKSFEQNEQAVVYIASKADHCTPKQSTISRVGVYGVAFQKERLLVIKQGKGPHRGKYDLPGGGIKPGETIEEALRREFREEVGMTFNTMRLLDNFSANTETQSGDENPYCLHQLGLIYQIEAASPLSNTSPETEFAWMTIKQLSKMSVAPLLFQALHHPSINHTGN